MALTKIKTNKGVVVGKAGEISDCSVFLGIPFAKPPVGELRFAPPEEIDAWDGEKECFSYGPAPIQGYRGFGPKHDISEDCLTINVFTPAKSADEKLPVMCWIYGGGFTGGASSDIYMYGEKLTEKGVIVVSFNYRLGIFGYIAHKELDKKFGKSTNVGLLDQVMALNWIQDNIAAFGGDPKRVMIHGQSAGGVSVRMHLVSPLSEGMFSRAIVQSGGGYDEADLVRERDDMESIVNKCLEHLGWSFDDLLTRPATEVFDSMEKAARETADGFEVGYFQPFIDGYTLPDVPGKLIAEGKYRDVPIAVGTVTGDAWMFSRKVKDSFTSDKQFRGFSLAPSQAWASENVRLGRTPIYTYYMMKTQPVDPENPMTGAKSKAPVWGRQTPHFSDVPYIFGTLDRSKMEFKDDDYELAEAMQIYWTNFCKNGIPGGGDNIPEWTPYTNESRLTLVLGDDGIAMKQVVESEIEQECIDITIRKPGMLSSLD